MKAISLWQPWASFCVVAPTNRTRPPKHFETRSWPFPDDLEGERILIHASKRWGRDQISLFNHVRERWDERFPDDPPLGCIVGSVRLVGCSRTEHVRLHVGPLQRELGDYSDGRYAWRLGDPIAFDEPIPFTGRQRFFNVPAKVVAGQLAVHLSN